MGEERGLRKGAERGRKNREKRERHKREFRRQFEEEEGLKDIMKQFHTRNYLDKCDNKVVLGLQQHECWRNVTIKYL